MTQAVAKVEPIEVTGEMIKKYICPTATDQELFIAVNIAKSYGLNPFKREVHIIKYGSAPAQVVVGYEVYIKRAERTGLLDGWKVTVSPDDKYATITIHRKDQSHPFEWTVSRSEFDRGQANWKTMPGFMLKKVAIGQGFRLCFPDEMGGLPYLPEEISVVSSEALPTGDVSEDAAPSAPSPPPVAAKEPGNPPAPAPAPAKQMSFDHLDPGVVDDSEDEEALRDHLVSICDMILSEEHRQDGGPKRELSALLHELTVNKEGKFGKTKVRDIFYASRDRKFSPLKLVIKKAEAKLEALYKSSAEELPEGL